jgi:hypothetical protein
MIAVLPAMERPVRMWGLRINVVWILGAAIAMGFLAWHLSVRLAYRILLDERPAQERPSHKDDIAFVCCCYLLTALLFADALIKATDRKAMISFTIGTALSGAYTRYLYRGGRIRFIIF